MLCLGSGYFLSSKLKSGMTAGFTWWLRGSLFNYLLKPSIIMFFFLISHFPVKAIPPMSPLSPVLLCPLLYNFRTSYMVVSGLIVSSALFISGDRLYNRFSSKAGSRPPGLAMSRPCFSRTQWSWVIIAGVLYPAHACRITISLLCVYLWTCANEPSLRRICERVCCIALARFWGSPLKSHCLVSWDRCILEMSLVMKLGSVNITKRACICGKWRACFK